jgi:hypothetical protein
MTLLLISFTWTLILLLIVGLCIAARLGDQAQPERISERISVEAVAANWEQRPAARIAAVPAGFTK